MDRFENFSSRRLERLFPVGSVDAVQGGEQCSQAYQLLLLRDKNEALAFDTAVPFGFNHRQTKCLALRRGWV